RSETFTTSRTHLSPSVPCPPPDPRSGYHLLVPFTEGRGRWRGIVKRYWDEHELAEHWSLNSDELELLANRTARSRPGLAVLLKFFQVEGRFPRDRREIPAAVRDHLADQLGIEPDAFAEYDLTGRSGKRDREQIRSLLGFRRVTLTDAGRLAEWLRRD